MSPKEEDQRQRSTKTQRQPSKRPSSNRSTSHSPRADVYIGRDVKNSKISVNVSSPSLLAQKIQQYQDQPSHLLSDLSFLAIVCVVAISVSYLVFVISYYASKTTSFSTSGKLLLFTSLDHLVYRLLYVVGIVFLIVTAYRFLRGYATVSEVLNSSLWILCLGLLAYFLMISATKLRPWLIQLNYSVLRADELVSIGRFDLAKEVLLLYPEDKRMPSYTIALADNRKSEKANYPSPPYYQDKERNEALKTFDKFAQQLYDTENYQELLESVCKLSNTDLWEGIMPHWQEAAYILSHDPAWGTERTLNLINQLNQQYPDCTKISSPFWIAIPQEVAWTVQEGFWDQSALDTWYDVVDSSIPDGKTIDETLQDTNVRDECGGSHRCEYDMRLLDNLLVMFPEDKYADYGKFLLGRWNQIVQEGYDANPHTYALAYYERGLGQYEQKDFEGALKTFQGFLFMKEFSDHPWRDDALWRAAMCYEKLGKYFDALEYLSQMEGAPDGYVPEYADEATNALYIADVLMPIDELTRAVSENMFPSLLPLLKYTLAERLLAMGSYSKSREIFVEIANQYADQEFTPRLGKKFSYAALAQQKIKVIDVLMAYEKEHPKDAKLFIADYLDTYEAFTPLENELRYYLPMFEGREVTTEYLVNRSKYYVAASLREEYINANPQDTRVPELLFKIAQGYETVASWKDLPVSKDFLPSVQKKASDAYLKYLDHPTDDKQKLDYALEHAGSLYFLQCHYGGEDFECDPQNVIAMRTIYSELVNKYPHHRLANNMLNWVAWSYCYEANLPGVSDQQYIASYQLAQGTYYRIATNYSDGAIGENARRNIQIIQERLLDPSHRAKFAPPNWGW